jgi:hypothetical protein
MVQSHFSNFRSKVIVYYFFLWGPKENGHQAMIIFGLASVDCSGKSLRFLRKIWGFWNTFSSNELIKTRKNPWGTWFSCLQLPNYMGCLTEFYESFTLFYTKMSFKILKISVRLFPEQSTFESCHLFRIFIRIILDPICRLLPKIFVKTFFLKHDIHDYLYPILK